ncbi:hypothetical protein AAKU55_003359 [Oxalobacteraceae bacterium GrIS 1.11]
MRQSLCVAFEATSRDYLDAPLVYMADREANLAPWMSRAQESGTPTDWLAGARPTPPLSARSREGQ